MKSRKLRAAILLLLDDRHRIDSSRTVDDTEIAEALDALIEDVRRQLDILAAEGLTKEAYTFGGHSAYIAPKGMAIAEEIRERAESDEDASRPPIGFDG